MELGLMNKNEIMKFCIYKKELATICLLSFFASCQESEKFLPTNEECKVYFSVDKFVGDVSTRTNVDPANNYAITWADGDAIGIFPREGYQEPFEIPSDQIGLSKAQFDGGYWALKEGLTYNAYYPFDKANFESAEMKTQIAVTYLGQSQEGTACNVGAYDYTYSDWTVAPAEGSVSFKFHHVGAFVVFKLEYPQTAAYTQLTISASDAVIPTTGSYDLTAETVALVPDEDALSTSLCLALENCSGVKGETGTFYMMFPPMALDDGAALTVTLTDANGTDYNLSTNIGTTFKAGKLYEVTMEESMFLLPKGSDVQKALSSVSSGYESIRFVANSSATSDVVLFTDENGTKAYAVNNSSTLEIHTSKAGFLANADCSNMFYALGLIKGIYFGEDFDTRNVTNMRYMFDSSWSLYSLDLSGFDTGNVTDMRGMFSGCKGLSSLDLSGFDTGNVTNMGYMFYDCTVLSSLDLRSFDTGNVTDMGYMFYGCQGLSSLDLSGFKTGNVTYMSYMFYGCYGLSSLDVSGFDTGNVTYMSNMFNRCSGLSSLDLSGFDTGNVTDISYMFFCCSGLSSLDLSNFSFAGNPSVFNMFYGTGEAATSKPITIKVSSEGYTYLTSTTTDCGINSSYATLRSN
ncbi:MAG: BspA family leucine-rich repeat surface protein [Bacteroidaceae bacterium]|nr:BspA family leucine-rich repeat surface protein [Bacteroidaceae bacterium]